MRNVNEEFDEGWLKPSDPSPGTNGHNAGGQRRVILPMAADKAEGGDLLPHGITGRGEIDKFYW